MISLNSNYFNVKMSIENTQNIFQVSSTRILGLHIRCAYYLASSFVRNLFYKASDLIARALLDECADVTLIRNRRITVRSGVIFSHSAPNWPGKSGRRNSNAV